MRGLFAVTVAARQQAKVLELTALTVESDYDGPVIPVRPACSMKTFLSSEFVSVRSNPTSRTTRKLLFPQDRPTLNDVVEALEAFKERKLLHARYAAQILVQAHAILSSEQTLQVEFTAHWQP